jgi:hypothetical protein
VLVDLERLPEPEKVLDALAVLMRPQAVLVITALAALPSDEIQARGFTMLSRPISIAEIVAAANRAVSRGQP